MRRMISIRSLIGFSLFVSVIGFSTPAALAGQLAAQGTAPPAVSQPTMAPTPPGTTAPAAQTPRPGTPPPGAPRDILQVAGLSYSGQNVMLSITITDALNADIQNKKSVMMLIADGRSGQIRSSGSGAAVINVDARPQTQRDGRIYLQLTVEYQPELSNQQAQQLAQQTGVRLTTFTESLSLIVGDGKPVLASQSADPRSDRKVSLEVTATIVR
jgi:hypothetical protein